jgi:hypothetical protein
MAFEYLRLVRTYSAGADLSAKQFFLVKYQASDNSVVPITADTDVPFGVLQNNPASGGAAEVMHQGISKCSADAAITRGAAIGTSADGQFTTRTIGTDTTKYVVGVALETASGANSLISCMVNCMDPHRAA